MPGIPPASPAPALPATQTRRGTVTLAQIPSALPLVVADGGSLIVQDNTQVAPTEDIYFAGSATLLMKGTGIIRFVNK